MLMENYGCATKVAMACLVAAAVSLLGGALASCGLGAGRNDERDFKLKAALESIDDSIKKGSPRVGDMIKKGMAEAKDSLDYYDFRLRDIRYGISLGVSDSTKLNWNDAYKYLTTHERTPRTRGMLALAKNLMAAYYYKFHYSPDIAISIFRSAYDDLFGSDAEHNLPDVCANLGDAYCMANDMPKAAMWYRRALFLADSLKLPEKENLSLYMGLGRIYLNLHDYNAALECYRKTDRNIDLMPIGMQAYFLNNYGNYYYFTGDYKAALATFNRLKVMLERYNLKDSYEMFLCKLNMADVHLNLNQTAEATQCLDEAEAFFRRIDDKTGLYYAHTIRMGLALKEGNVTEVKRILDEEHIDEADIEFQLTNIRQRYLREYFVKKGDYRRAYDNLSRSIVRNDSLKHNLENMRAADIMTRYTQDTLVLHNQIAMQEKDADIRKAHWGLFVGVLLASILALFTLFMFTWSHKRRLQMQMELMNLKLMSARSRISPHFIFNVLNNRISKTDKRDADELMSLVKLIRTNLDLSDKSFISLKDELDFVRYYISVEQHCIDGGIELCVDAPADEVLERIMIPSMFIQILVENSIKHGLKGRKGDKRLCITVSVGEEDCKIKVEDNGTGFDIRHSDPNSTGMGLRIIRSMIDLINRESKRKVSLTISNLGGEGPYAGTEVVLQVPLNLPPRIFMKEIYTTTDERNNHR